MSELVGQETGRRWVEALYRENYEVVRRLARSLLTGNLKSMAEDVAQEVFVDAQVQQEALKRHPNVRGWLMLTTKYKCFNLLRTRKKVQVIYIDDEEMERIEDEHCAWQLQAALETPRSREDVDRALQENLSPNRRCFTSTMKSTSIASSLPRATAWAGKPCGFAFTASSGTPEA